MENFIHKILKYHLLWIILINLLFILLSERLKIYSKKYLILHKDIWNNILFFSFFICALTGLLIYFSFFKNIDFTLYKIHLYTGIISFFAGLYHFLERALCMQPFKKLKNKELKNSCPNSL